MFAVFRPATLRPLRPFASTLSIHSIIPIPSNRLPAPLATRPHDRIVVRAPWRWWAFDSPDFGVNWRLVETGHATMPVVAKLHYQADSLLPSSLEYPDGKRATFTPSETNPDAIGIITLPSGIAYHIKYDPSSFARLLEEHVPSDKPPQKVVDGFTIANVDGEIKQVVNYREIPNPPVKTRVWVFENDHLGRIRHYVGPCDTEYTLDFAERQVREEARIETTVILTNTRTGDYRYLRHIETPGTWDVSRGHGSKAQTLDQANRDSRIVQKRMGTQMKIVESHGSSGNYSKYTYTRNGKEKERTVHAADGTVLRTYPAASATAASPWQRSGDDRILGYRVGCETTCQQVTYDYDNRGFLQAAIKDGKRHTFTCDDFGRIERYEHPDGYISTWTYHANTLVATIAEEGPRPWSPRSTEKTMETFRYDPLDNLRSREQGSGYSISYRYNCNGLQRIHRPTRDTRVFVYNVDGTVDKEMTYDSKTEQLLAVTWYKYEVVDQPRVRAMRTKLHDAPARTIWYRYDDQAHRRIEKIEGPAPDEQELTRIKRTATTTGGGTTTVVKYNDHHAVIFPPETTETKLSTNQ